MRNKTFEHLLKITISDLIQYYTNKSKFNQYHPLDNIFYDIDFVAWVSNRELKYTRLPESESLEHYLNFEYSYNQWCIFEPSKLLAHSNFSGIITEYELLEMLEDVDLNEIIRDEMIGLIKGAEHS